MKRYQDDIVANESDEDSVGGELSLWRQMAPTLGAHVDARYYTYGYDSAIGMQRDFDTILLALGLDKVFNPKLRVGALVGWQNVAYDDPNLDTQNDPYVQLNIRGQTVPSVRLMATATYGIRDADVYPFASQQYTDFHGRMEWDTTAKVTLAAYGTWRLSSYDADMTPTIPGGIDPFPKASDGDETTIVAAGEISYKINDRNSIKFVQRIEDVDSDVATSYTKNISTLIGTLAF
jgi:hypothetical protein